MVLYSDGRHRYPLAATRTSTRARPPKTLRHGQVQGQSLMVECVITAMAAGSLQPAQHRACTHLYTPHPTLR